MVDTLSSGGSVQRTCEFESRSRHQQPKILIEKRIDSGATQVVTDFYLSPESVTYCNSLHAISAFKKAALGFEFHVSLKTIPPRESLIECPKHDES